MRVVKVSQGLYTAVMGPHEEPKGHRMTGPFSEVPRLVSSPMWSDNVGRMHLFMEKHPEVKVTVPRQNGTPDFIATWPDGELKDTSLGWLMDKLEKLFARP